MFKALLLDGNSYKGDRMRQLVNRISLLVAMLFVIVSATASAAITPALWKIEHQGKVSYLFGSIHFGQSSWYPLSTPIERAYAAADALVVELDMTIHQRDVRAAMMLPKGETLKQHLSQKAYSTLISYLNQQHIPEPAVASIKPWAVANMIAVLPYLKLGLDPNLGIDSQFLTRAKQDSKPVIELETVQFQIELLTTLFDNENALLDAIAMPDNIVVSLLSLWQQGELAAIERLVKNQLDRRKYQRLLVNRNRNWVNQLLTRLNDSDSLFIVVGVAHLIGADGVPALLTERGLKVTRVQ